MVATSRPGWPPLPFPTTAIRLAPLTKAQVWEFVKHRLRPDDAASLQEAINQHPSLSALSRTPYFLELLCKCRGAVADSLTRAELYERALQAAAGDSHDRLLAALAVVAWKAFRLDGGRGPISADAVQCELKAKGVVDAEAMEKELKKLVVGRVLIRLNSEAVTLFRFSHRSILEYLAARWLAAQIEPRRPRKR